MLAVAVVVHKAYPAVLVVLVVVVLAVLVIRGRVLLVLLIWAAEVVVLVVVVLLERAVRALSSFHIPSPKGKLLNFFLPQHGKLQLALLQLTTLWWLVVVAVVSV
jgi:glucan phosphoethanolaminetransferase (alkaline phosphatase superfamily)